MTTNRYDVAIVGASIAGCAAAMLFSKKGARIALIERERAMDAYKKVCTHFIQPSATPTIQRLGLAGPIEEAGGIRNDMQFWTRWGWVRKSPREPRYGYNIRRQTLDPIIRERASNAPGVDFIPGESVHELIFEAGRPVGVRTEGRGGAGRTVEAGLIVAADGRRSRIADLAGIPLKTKKNARFAYFAYYRNLSLVDPACSQMWFLEPDMAYIFPNDAEVTLAAAMPEMGKLAQWKGDTEGSFLRLFSDLPKAPALKNAERISPFIGMLDMTNSTRRVSLPGLALVGDAALAADPLAGVGCGWAFQSAEWLVDATADSLDDRTQLDAALAKYRRRHRWELGGHEFFISDFSTGRSYNPLEKLLFSAAARDQDCADHVTAFGSRLIGAMSLLSPGALLRASAVNLKHRRSQGNPNGQG